MGPMNSVVTEARKWASSTSETQDRPRSAPVKTLNPLTFPQRSRPKPNSKQQTDTPEEQTVVQYVNEICKLHDDIHDLNDQIETLKNRKKARVDINVHTDDLEGIDENVDPRELKGDEFRFPE